MSPLAPPINAVRLPADPEAVAMSAESNWALVAATLTALNDAPPFVERKNFPASPMTSAV